MIPYSIEPTFTKAIADSLPAGEILGAVSDAFFCSWENYWAKDLFGNDVQRRRDWVSGTTTVAITNVAVRLVGFKTTQVLSPEQELKKKAFLEKGHSEEKATKKAIGLFGKPITVPIPELASQTSYQIADVSAINYQRQCQQLLLFSTLGSILQKLEFFLFLVEVSRLRSTRCITTS